MARAAQPPAVSSAHDALLRRGPRMALALLGGGALALGHAPFGWALPAVLGLFLVVFAVSQAPSPKAGGWTAWLAATAYFAVLLRWITEPFQVDAAAHGWMAPFALALMAGGLGLFWALAGALAARLSLRARPVGFALALSAVEFARAHVLTGFPWGQIAGLWLDTPIWPWLGWIGPHGLGLLSALIIALLLGRGARRWIGLGLGAAACALAFVAAPVAPTIPPEAPVIRLVQPNAPQHLKWDPDWVPVFYRRQIDATEAPGTPDLTVWPETAVALRLPRDADGLSRIAEAANGRPLLLGLNRFTGPRIYNSAVLLAPDGTLADQYDKAHLVPFGEYIPLGAWLGKFGLRGLADTDGGGYSAGTGPALIGLGPLGDALPLICYEAIFPHFGRALSAEARVMLHLTNDAWFGTEAGPQQHLDLARMRAIERGLPVIRVANTGISAMIDSTGTVLEQIPLNQTGHLDTALPPRRPATVYVKFGETGFVFLWFVAAFWVAAFVARSRH